MTRNPVAILWDHASCPSPSDSSNEYTFAIRLREVCRPYGNINLFKIYYGLPANGLSTLPQTDVSLALESAGVTPVHRPKVGFGTLATDALCFFADNLGESPTVIFVTGNPALAYTASALKARNVTVGFIVPPGQPASDLSAYASWVLEWGQVMDSNETELGFNTKPSTTDREILSNLAALHNASSQAAGPCDDNQPVHDPSSVEGKMPDSAQTRTPSKSEKKRQARRPTYKVSDVDQPLDPVKGSAWTRVTTTVHTLQILETEPLFVDLIGDPEAIKVKTWRRQLKQIFYHEGVSQNPQVPTKLESLFSEIEQYDKMTRNYLAFSRIGKLMTQMWQTLCYLGNFDYRQGYASRTKALIVKWQEIADSSGV